MLQFIRDRAQSWIAFLIVGMLILGLASVAWEAYFGPDPEVSVAKVNGEKITANEFQRAYQQQRARLQQMLGGADISPFIPDEAEFKKGILKGLENDEVVLQKAEQAGFRVSDGLLAQQIRSFDAFQAQGTFSPELYQQWLGGNFMSPGDFEELLRRDIMLQQYRSAIADTAWVTESEAVANQRRQGQLREAGYVTIPTSNYVNDITVSDDDAKRFFDENSDRFRTDEKVSIEYLELSAAALAKDVDIDEGVLEEQYQEHQSEFGVPEERRTRHILIEIPGSSGDEEAASAREKAEALVLRIRNGESFELLAKESSDDIGSANDGGDLGFLARDMMMDAAFADAAFALSVGDVSEPVRTAYGFHIIKLEGIKAGKQKSFDEVRDQLADDYRQRQAEDEFFEQGEILANLVFENPDSLEVAAEELGLPIKSTPMFTRDSGVGIAANPDVRSLAFSDEVLGQGLNSEPFDVSPNHFVVLRVKEHQESVVRPFEEVKDEIVAQIKQQRAEAAAEEDGNRLLSALAEGGDIEILAKENKFQWQHLGEITRSDGSVDQDVLSEVFSMSRPQDNQVVYGGVALASGDYAVVALTVVKDGEPDADSAQLARVKSDRARYYGYSELTSITENLRNAAEIIEYPDNL